MIEFSFLNLFVDGCCLECIVEVDLPVKILGLYGCYGINMLTDILVVLSTASSLFFI